MKRAWDRPNLYSGRPWNVRDIADLTYSFARGQTIEEVAEFICRSPKEVDEQAESLGIRFGVLADRPPPKWAR